MKEENKQADKRKPEKTSAQKIREAVICVVIIIAVLIYYYLKK